MAIQAQIRKDINEYQPKLFFGLSGRQLIFSISGVAVGIGSYFLLRKLIGNELAGYVVIALVSPLFALGFIKVDGEPFERYLLKLYRFAVYPKARVYTSYISHHPSSNRQVTSNKEQNNVKRAKYGNYRETTIEEYNVVARQRENAAAYKRIK